MKDRVKFTEFMTFIGEIFDKKISQILLDGYWKALSNISDEEASKAFTLAFTECKFFPKPVELIELSKGRHGATLEDIGYAEAAKVLNAVKRVGYTKSVVFADEVTMGVIKQGFGGWVKLCNDLKAEEEKWFLKDFTKLYQSFTRTGTKHSGFLSGVVYDENGWFRLEDKEDTRYAGVIESPVYIDEGMVQKGDPIMIEGK